LLAPIQPPLAAVFFLSAGAHLLQLRWDGVDNELAVAPPPAGAGDTVRRRATRAEARRYARVLST
jgi:hypothetical protein